MMSFIKSKVTLSLLLFMFLASVASAQTSPDAKSLMNRINQLERQLETLSRAFYGEGKVPKQMSSSPEGGEVSSSAISDFDERLNGIEQTNKETVNKLEKLGYDLSVLQDEFKKMKLDTEQRFQESSATTASPASEEVANEATASEDESATDTTSTTETAGTAPTPLTNGKAEVMYEKAFSKIKDSDYVAAQEGFKQFIASYPESNLAPNAYYWLGETYYVAADYKSAAKSFARCFQKYPDSSKAPDSLFKLALSLAAMGNTKDACLSLDQLKKQSKIADGPIGKKAEAEFKKLKCE